MTNAPHARAWGGWTPVLACLSLLIAAATGIASITPYTADVVLSIAVAAAAAASWNISAGYAGDLSLGHGAFYGLGAYASVLFLGDLGVTPWLGILTGAAIAGCVAAVLGLVTIRLRGPFFAIATLGLVEIGGALSLFFVSLTHGGEGISVQTTPSFWHMNFTDAWQYVLVMMVILVLITIVTRAIRYSTFGYRLLAFRDNEVAARALGIAPIRARIVALVISAMLISLVGGVQVQYLQFISASSAFSLTFSIQVALVAIVGGIGTIYGPLIGACLIIPVGNLLVPALTAAGGAQQLVYGILLVAALLVFRQGVAGLLVEVRNRLRRSQPAPVHLPTPVALATVPVAGIAATFGAESEPRATFVAPPAQADPPTLLPSDASPVSGLPVEPARAASLECVGAGSPTGTVVAEPPLLTVEDVSIAFGGLKALDHVSLRVKRGSITAIIGPNGAGKSTLFSVLSGFAIPLSGSVHFEGRRLNASRPEEIARGGLVRTFQTSQLFAQLTVRENVIVGALISSASLAKAHQRADVVLADLDLSRLADKQSSALSLGDRRRLELGRALAARPSLLLLDEILAGLSVQEYEEVITLLLAVRNTGVTLLMTEHIMDAITRMSDHVYVLDHGRVIASGTSDEVKADPHVVVAYLGSELDDAYR